MEENSEQIDNLNLEKNQNSNPFKKNGQNSQYQNIKKDKTPHQQRMDGLKKSGTVKKAVTSEQENNNKLLEEEVEKLKIENDSLKKEIEDWKSKSIRLAADIQNIHKQNEFEIGTAKKSTKKRILNPVLTFLNTLNLSFAHAPNTDDSTIIDFIKTLKNSFEQIFKDLKLENIEIIRPNIGDSFDVETMNILNPGETSQDKEVLVKAVVSLGLKIDEQVIIPASIMI